MVRGNEVRVGADERVRDVHTTAAQRVDLISQHVQVKDDTVTEDRSGVRVEDTGRQQVHEELLGTDDDGVSSIVASRVPHAVVNALGHLVGGLALALVTPLGTHDDDSRHLFLHFLAPVCGLPPVAGAHAALQPGTLYVVATTSTASDRGAKGFSPLHVALRRQYVTVDQATVAPPSPMAPSPSSGRTGISNRSRLAPSRGRRDASGPKCGSPRCPSKLTRL